MSLIIVDNTINQFFFRCNDNKPRNDTALKQLGDSSFYHHTYPCIQPRVVVAETFRQFVALRFA